MNDVVYLVWNDNGEPYEDHFQCVERVFSTLEKAEKYLTEERKCQPVKTRWETTWEPEKPTCPGGKTFLLDCPEEKCPFCEPEFINLENGEREFYGCKHAEILDENYDNHTFFFVEEKTLE